MKGDAKLQEFIVNPVLQRKAKQAALTKIAAHLKLTNLSTNLLSKIVWFILC
jgi:hypothetical protein